MSFNESRDRSRSIEQIDAIIIAAVLQGISRCFARIADAAKVFLPRQHPISAENIVQLPEARAGHACCDADASASAEQSCAAGLEVNAGPPLSLGPTRPDAQEIERRRDLVRTLFNDFWCGTHSKPGSFAARLDEAEDYLNMRLAANGESWRLDAKTRASLGLPARSGSPH